MRKSLLEVRPHLIEDAVTMVENKEPTENNRPNENYWRKIY